MASLIVPPTPAMQQYLRMKAEQPDALLFFRMGDFYEMFFDDAVAAAKALEIALTSRSKDRDGAPIPMCGVPHHSAPGYISRLVEQGFKVALCEQMEDPKSAKGVVKREIVRVITPGTQIDAAALADDQAAFVVALCPGASAVGAAYLDATTGDFTAAEWRGESAWERCRDDLLAMRPRELLVPAQAALPAWLSDPAQAELRLPKSELEASAFDPERGRQALLQHFGALTLQAFGCESLPQATAAAAAALGYVRDTQRRDLVHVTSLVTRDPDDALVLDSLTRRNLELVENQADGGKAGTLYATLDATRTAMGARLLKQWILRPLRNVPAIQDRLDAVEELAFRTIDRGALREALQGIQDLDRLLGRVTLGSASPRDLSALARSLRSAPAAEQALGAFLAPLARRLAREIEPPLDVAEDVAATLADEPPASLKDAGAIRDGVDAELDALRAVSRGGKEQVAAIEERERRRTGIASLKVRFNRVFGYYIEVSKANLPLVPADYRRKQTIAGGERFVTPELQEYEAQVTSADERILAREGELLEALRARVAAAGRRIQRSSAALGALDALQSLAEIACRNDYVKPRVDDGDELSFGDGRHPIMERVLKEPFVANDLVLGGDAARLYILTGPNMGGKSTFLRQTALIALMAQMGSFVPARAARVGVADRIFTRVGASDQILRGQSTFLVEMQETAHILRHGTPKSLVLLDEIGRGTATFDGLSIAWAVAEELARDPRRRARTLFATHYHELTDLAADIPGVANLHVAAREWKDGLVFLRRIEPGGSDRSFGIQVARLAGLPAAVVVRAQEILRNLERTEFDREGRPRLAHSEEPERAPRQLPLFSSAEEGVLAELRRLDTERLTPLAALALLDELKRRVDRA